LATGLATPFSRLDEHRGTHRHPARANLTGWQRFWGATIGSGPSSRYTQTYDPGSPEWAMSAVQYCWVIAARTPAHESAATRWTT